MANHENQDFRKIYNKSFIYQMTLHKSAGGLFNFSFNLGGCWIFSPKFFMNLFHFSAIMTQAKFSF